MKKLVLMIALTMLFSVQANAADRDCVQYTGAQAAEATSDDASNTVGIVFSGKTSRKGLTNADCAAAAEPAAEEPATNTSGGNSGNYVIPDFPVVPEIYPEIEDTHAGGSN